MRTRRVCYENVAILRGTFLREKNGKQGRGTDGSNEIRLTERNLVACFDVEIHEVDDRVQARRSPRNGQVLLAARSSCVG